MRNHTPLGLQGQCVTVTKTWFFEAVFKDEGYICNVWCSKILADSSLRRKLLECVCVFLSSLHSCMVCLQQVNHTPCSQPEPFVTDNYIYRLGLCRSAASLVFFLTDPYIFHKTFNPIWWKIGGFKDFIKMKIFREEGPKLVMPCKGRADVMM